jgi:hypothetical protein
MKNLEESKDIYQLYEAFINNVIVLSTAWKEETIIIKNFILNEVDKYNMMNQYKLYSEANKYTIELIEKEWEYITKKTNIENIEKEREEKLNNLNK